MNFLLTRRGGLLLTGTLVFLSSFAFLLLQPNQAYAALPVGFEERVKKDAQEAATRYFNTYNPQSTVPKGVDYIKGQIQGNIYRQYCGTNAQCSAEIRDAFGRIVTEQATAVHAKVQQSVKDKCGSNPTPDCVRTAAQAGAAQARTDAAGKSGESLCAWGTTWFKFGLSGCLSGIIYVFSVGLTAPLAYVAAKLFEFSVAFSLSSVAYSDAIIANGWTIMRDVANMGFLFALIYIAFSLILGLQGIETKKFLTRVILIALVVNFSFFISRVVIDAGNVLALQFYKQIQDGGGQASANGAGVQVFGAKLADAKSLTNGIMQGLQLQGLLGNANFKNWVGQETTSFFDILITLSFIFLAMGAMLAILAYAFLVAAVKFMVRVVVLWFTIIISPLAFVSYIFPQTESYFGQWWREHLKHAFFPAAFMFIFLILVAFMGSMQANGGIFDTIFAQLTGQGGANAVSLYQTQSSTFSGFLSGIAAVSVRLAFVIILLLLAIRVGDSFGVMGGKFATSVGNWAKGKAFRTGGWGFKQSLGRLGGFADKKFAGTRAGSSELGYGLRKLTTKPLAGVSVGGAESYKGFRDRMDKEAGERAGERRDIENKELAGTVIDHLARPGATLDDATLSANASLAKAAARMKELGKREFESLGAEKVRKLAPAITEKQLDETQKIDSFTEAEKEGIKTDWHATSDSAPAKKANKMITELRAINATLGVLAVAANTAPTTVVDGTRITSMRTEVETRKTAANITFQTNRMRGNAPGMLAAQTDMNNADKALDLLKKMDEERKKIPQLGSTLPGRFTVV